MSDKFGTLSSFTAQIRNSGIARQNRYGLLLTKPKSMMAYSAVLPELNKLALYCSAADVPSSSFASSDHVLPGGETRSYATGRVWDNFDATFYVDSDYKVKLFFDSWMQAIQNPKSKAVEYYNEYVADLELTALNMAGQDVYSYKMVEAWPKSVGRLSFAADAAGIQTINVSFAYRRAEITKVVEAPQGQSSELNRVFGLQYIKQSLQDAVKLPGQYLSDFNAYQSSLFSRGMSSLIS